MNNLQTINCQIFEKKSRETYPVVFTKFYTKSILAKFNTLYKYKGELKEKIWEKSDWQLT